MFCNECGKKIKEDALFCPECGAKVERAELVKESPVKHKQISSKNVILISSIILIVGLSIGIIVLIGKNNKDINDIKKSNETLNKTVEAKAEADKEKAEKEKVEKEKAEKEKAEKEALMKKQEESMKAKEEVAVPKIDTTNQAQANNNGTPASAEGDSSYIWAESNSKYYGESDLEGLSAPNIRLIRNEIYARKGYIFTKEDMAEYFGKKSWYHGSIAAENFTEAMFNQYELANVHMINAYEKAHGINP